MMFVDPIGVKDVLEHSGDRVYPILLTPFPFDPLPKSTCILQKVTYSLAPTTTTDTKCAR